MAGAPTYPRGFVPRSLAQLPGLPWTPVTLACGGLKVTGGLACSLPISVSGSRCPHSYFGFCTFGRNVTDGAVHSLNCRCVTI